MVSFGETYDWAHIPRSSDLRNISRRHAIGEITTTSAPPPAQPPLW
jgi:hypothetical protein